MKIAVIGGAGVRTVIFINGLLARYKKLNIDEVVLYDIQEEKQRMIARLCKHVVNRKNEELKVWAVSDPVEAINPACRRRSFSCSRRDHRSGYGCHRTGNHRCGRIFHGGTYCSGTDGIL